jgi:cytidylate kinase
MNKKHLITIAGKLGSGKSSTAKKVAEMLKYKHLSSGDFMRDLASERGISLMELNRIAEGDGSIDKELDNRNIEIGKQSEIILDSRLGFYFIPDSFRVYLDLPLEVSAERILRDKENNPNRLKEDSASFDTKEDVMKSIRNRQESERLRYEKLYGIKDVSNADNFDLIIDTSKYSLEEVAQKIVEEYKKWLIRV